MSTEGHRSRLRERFMKSGFSGFHDYEVVELILTLSIARKDVKGIAKDLIKRFGSLRGILDAEEEELRSVAGVGNITAISLKVMREVASLYLKEQAELQPVLNNSDKLEAFFQARLMHLRHEVFEVAFLDNRYRLMKNGVQRVHEGTINETVVYQRSVMEKALKHSASAIVFAHNHPSGHAQASEEDIHLTRLLISAARTLSVEVVDHVIIAGKEIFSFRRNGMIGAH